MAITPQQSGSDLAGPLTVGGFEIVVSGRVDTAGVVRLSGSAELAPGQRFTLQEWRGTLNGATLSGTYQYRINNDQPLGGATVSGNFTLSK